VLLTSYLALTAAGLAFFALGKWAEYTGVAVIGAVLILAVGGAVALGGIQVKDGESVDRDVETIELVKENGSTVNETVVRNVSRTNEYRDVEVLSVLDSGTTTLGLGGLHLLLGGVLISRKLEDDI